MQVNQNTPYTAATVQSASHGALAANPFQSTQKESPAASASVPSSIAGEGIKSPFCVVESKAERRTKLPERRLPPATIDSDNGILREEWNGNEGSAAMTSAAAARVSAPAPELISQCSVAETNPGANTSTPLKVFREVPASEQPEVPEPQQIPAARQAFDHSSLADNGTAQLALRAIFGVSHELTAEEVLQLARTLPGIRSLNIVEAAEARAIQRLRKKVAQLCFGQQHSIALSSCDGDFDIIEEDGSTLAVLHEDGGYTLGVHETLIIVARELARLNG